MTHDKPRCRTDPTDPHGRPKCFRAAGKKYQKSVHALAWRKVGDFHIAEEITQDTFLRVYKKLGTLKDLHRFEGMAL